jgi:hypothetical protein
MYEVGDKIVYPMYGAGIVEKIEEREILGSVRRYYIMKISTGTMNVMVPVENSEEIGIRIASEYGPFHSERVFPNPRGGQLQLEQALPGEYDEAQERRYRRGCESGEDSCDHRKEKGPFDGRAEDAGIRQEYFNQ